MNTALTAVLVNFHMYLTTQLMGERYIENRESSMRCKVEHAFRIIKCQFGYKKTVYRGLKKNENRLYALFACANLYSLAIAGRKLSTT